VLRDEGDGRLEVKLQNTDIRDVLEWISQDYGLNIMASKSVTGTVTANLSQVDLDTALAAILKSAGFIARREGTILYVGTPADFAQMDQTQDRVATRVYRPNYIKAADFQTLIESLLSPDVGKSTVSSPAEVDIPADQTKTGGNAFASGDVVVVHDYETVLRQIDAIFAEVDVKPKQVAIEAMILSVKLSDTFKLGVNFEALRNKDNVRLISGSPLASLAEIDVDAGGLKFGFMDESLGVFIDALETIGDTNVIAAPRLTCLNKQRAEIQIGEELGYISTTVTETSATQTVNFLDVGTLLRIRPFISDDGLVRLEVHPELSSGFIATEEGLSLPNKVVTQVTTNVMCPDGCTVIIGGLIREDLKTNTRQLPLLGNLPWLGPVFRQKTEEVERSEIIVVITPRIVSEPMMCEEGQKWGNEFTQRQSVYFDKMSPIAKRNYGLHHLRMARAAYAAGDYLTALKQVNLAIHYDPLNRDAIVLRNEVVAAGGFEDESIHEYLHRGLSPLTGRHRDYSKQGYPWKEFEGFGPPDLAGIDDPGQPGSSVTVERPRPLPPVIRSDALPGQAGELPPELP
jgi:type IV pilus assembly protein PilQ